MRKSVLLLFGAAALFAADYVAEGDLWWAHIQFLADDKLQGRDTGSDGYREAVRYVAGKMETYGLKPAGPTGRFDGRLPVPARRLRLSATEAPEHGSHAAQTVER